VNIGAVISDFLHDLCQMFNPAEVWKAVTYRNEWTDAPSRMRVKEELAGGYRVRSFDGDLLMFDVDRKSGRVRVAAARRAGGR
jgi:hypothetical protein